MFTLCMNLILLKMNLYTLLFYCIINIVMVNIELLCCAMHLNTMNKAKVLFQMHIVLFGNVFA